MAIENQIIRFELFRYQLLPLTQHVQMDMFPDETFRGISSVQELRARKNEIFAHVLSELPRLQYRQTELNHRMDLVSPPWFVIEINTQKTLEREREDFETERLDTWPHVAVIINNQPDVQLIAISRNQRAFSSGAVVAKLLQDNIQELLSRFYLNIQVEALFEKNKFWNLVEEYEGRISSVNFELISPNMANISKSLEIDLARLNADTNSHRTDLKLNSSDGGVLEIKRDNPLLNSLVDYSSQGGGDIELKIKRLKKTIRTSKSVREVSIDELSLKNLTPDRLMWILDQLS
jgi:hypothetical protein